MSTTQSSMKSAGLANLPTSTTNRLTRWKEFIIESLIRIAGVSAILIIGLIFFFLLREGISTFLDIPLRQLFGSRWYPIEGIYGMWPLLVGSFLVTVGAVVT